MQHRSYFACYHAGIKGVGVKLNPSIEKKRILHKWSAPHRIKFRHILQEKPELVDRAADIYEENLFGETFINELSTIPGTRKLLERLSKNYTLCVATGMHPKVMKKVFVKFGFPSVFSQITSNYDVHPELIKPHPYMIESAMELYGTKKDETIMVGDGESDVEMALAAGVTPVVVLTGHLTKQKADEMGVKYIIEDVTRLETVLAEINNPLI
jgi:HAD superfamily hydrolase (TIGR01549 family)